MPWFVWPSIKYWSKQRNMIGRLQNWNKQLLFYYTITSWKYIKLMFNAIKKAITLKSTIILEYVNQSYTQLKYETLCAIWYLLYNFKNVKNIRGGVLLLVKLQLPVTSLLYGWFSRFLNCTNETKSRKVSNMKSNLRNLISMGRTTL